MKALFRSRGGRSARSTTTSRPASRLTCLLGLVTMALCGHLYPAGASAQPVPMPDPAKYPDAYELVQDTMYCLRWYPNDTIPKGMICASYEYTMVYDSLCQVSYLITEWKRNGTPLKLPAWRDQRITNASPGYMSFNSQTEAFTCKTGDTLSLFRMLEWRTLRQGFRDVDGYAALDTLDYTVELVRLPDSTRVALIDSVGILPRSTPGKPRLYGSRPLIAPAELVIPSELDGITAFMRVRLYHRGDGPYWFTRRDATTSNLSAIMRRPWYNRFLAYYAPDSLMKRVRQHEVASSPKLSILPGGDGSRDVTLRFEAAPDGGSTSIMVCDISGRTLFYPMLWDREIHGTSELHYRFPQGGAYLVALLYKDQIQEVARWNTY